MQRLCLAIILCCLAQLLPTHAATAQAKPPARTPASRTNEYAAIDKTALQLPDTAAASTDGIAAYINTHFNSQKEKARAAFIWIASNIRYDIDNMFALNFYEKKEEKISKALKARTGICENYAALFDDICAKTGIKSCMVEGYTRQNGFTDYIPHAWCAALIDTTWYMFDPTWGSGYANNGKFISRINNQYFLVPPAVLVKSHMPFDYLWQCLYFPITSQEFYEGKTQLNAGKPFFNYPDSIAAFEKLDKTAAWAATADRIERNGIKNTMAFERLRIIRTQIEIEKQNKALEKQKQAAELYNSAVVDFNNSVHLVNEFIEYRNRQFRPDKPDSAIQAMIDTPAGLLKIATGKLDGMQDVDATMAALIDSFRKQLGDVNTRIEEQQTWLKKYFARGKLFRKVMFAQH